MTRKENKSGAYDFLTGISAFSGGVRAHDGYEIVRATFGEVVPWREGFDRIERQLESEKVVPSSLCSVELRCPRPYSSDGFDTFNAQYVDRLLSIGVFASGADNPVGRTNVAPLDYAPQDQGMFAFSYTRPATIEGRVSFVIAGGGEVRGGTINSDTIVRYGESSPDAIGEKAFFVLDVMEKRMTGLGLTWQDARMINIYTMHPVDGPVTDAILERVGAATVRGIHLFRAAPPVVDIEYEMDIKGPAWDLALP